MAEPQLIRFAKNLYLRQQFHPTLIGVFVNPFYLARRALVNAIKEESQNINGRVLDVGCGKKPYEKLFTCAEYIGLEFDTPENRLLKHADYFYDGITFPFDDDSFDSLICNEVLEHVFNPQQFICEIQRVLKPGGNLLLTVPFVWDEHEQPYDFGRYTSFGLKHILERTDLEVVKQIKTCSGFVGIFQLINAHLFKLTVSNNAYLNLLTSIILMTPFNLLGLIVSKSKALNQDFYLDNIAICRKI